MIVWQLLCQYVPDLDSAKKIHTPCWDEYFGNVILYAAGFDLYFHLCAKHENYHTQYHCLILFLEGIMAQHHVKVLKPLLFVVKSQ